MDFIFVKSAKAGKEDFGSVYARVRTGKANMKAVTGFIIRQLEWEKYRSLQYTSSALMSSIGIKYGQFAQVLARIKAEFEAEDFDPKKAKSIIESVKHDVLNGMMQIVEVKPKGKMLFEDFLTSYIEDLETGRRTKKGRTVKVTPAYIKGLRIILGQIRNYQKEAHRKIGLDDMTMETRNSLVGYWKERGLMPNAKTGSVTFDVAKAVNELKAGRVDFKVDKAGVLHAPLGKVSFGSEKILGNLKALLETVNRLKPSGAKGTYMLSMAVSTTMGPGFKIDMTQVKKFLEG